MRTAGALASTIAGLCQKTWSDFQLHSYTARRLVVLGRSGVTWGEAVTRRSLTALVTVLALVCAALASRYAPTPGPTPTPTPGPGREPAAQTAPELVPPRPAIDHLSRRGSRLYRGGEPFRFVGVVAPQLATWWQVNYGCGSQVSEADLDSLFGTFPPRSMVVTFNATQELAVDNKATPSSPVIDFTGIDRVFRAAERHGQLVMPVLASQSGVCDDGHWKDKSWYDAGYRQPYDDYGFHTSPLSFWDYLHRVVGQYQRSPALAGWTLVNEPEASNCAVGYRAADCYARLSCPTGAGASLRRFFDDVGGELKRLDPVHLLSSAVIGGDQCGLRGRDYALVHGSPAVDLCDVHEYNSDTEPLPPSTQAHIEDCLALGKPTVIGESGISANDHRPRTCMKLAERAERMKAKIDAHLAAGAQGFSIWQWDTANDGCGYGITFTDPTFALIGRRAGG